MNEERYDEESPPNKGLKKEYDLSSTDGFFKEDKYNIVQLDEHLLAEIEKIPSKMSFKIGEVSDLLQVKPYVLRYWEAEFDFFHPKKMDNGQRLYFRKDVESALLIKKLLYQDGFSIKGAKGVFQKLKKTYRNYHKKDVVQKEIIEDLKSLLKRISQIKSFID